MGGRCSIPSATIHGIEAIPVDVEVSIGQGLPGISIVGLPDSSVQEARLRVKAAIKAAGFTVPNSSIVVNLAPSSLRKVGSGFDLPIAIGILVSSGQVRPKALAGSTFVGELSLDGSVRPTSGLFAVAVMVASRGGTLVTGRIGEDLSPVLPQGHRVMLSLADLREGGLAYPQHVPRPASGRTLDYADIASQDFAKRALQIAAAGRHSVLMVGPPGSGKTMLARRLPTIMPPLTTEERMASALIHSVSGCSVDALLDGQRPFRAPHHSSTPAGLLGGGNPISPGEVSLAHNGILFLDEMPEFSSRVLQMLRQPIEEHHVTLARADGVYRFPSDFLLVGAANPCPCGYLGDPERTCTCAPGVVANYQNKIGGPLLDRFDMMVTVSRSDPKTVLETGRGVTSQQLFEQVQAARDFASWRRQRQFDGGGQAQSASAGADRQLVDSCNLDQQAQAHLERVAQVHRMSGRAIMKVLSVARTIADMAQAEQVTADNIAEASMYRMQDGE